MNLISKIEILRSKQQVEKLIRWIGTDSERFAQLMKLFLGDDQELSRRSAWVVGHCCERHPKLAQPWLKRMIRKMQEPNGHCAIQRNVMHTLQFVEIPESLKGKVTTICFDMIADTKIPIASQVFAMTVAANIAKNKPPLLNELKTLVHQMLPYGTAAFHARARKIFKDLSSPKDDAVMSRSEEEKILYDWLMKKG
jgi:hypothetical protein